MKMLYTGNLAEVSRRAEQQRKAKVFNRRHDFCKHTRCTSTKEGDYDW